MTTAVASRLTAADRCDRCGAQAYVWVRLASGGELIFCGHHGRLYEPQLRESAVEWHDETDRLIEASRTTDNTN